MEVDDIVLIGALFTVAWYGVAKKKKKPRKKRVHRWWVRPWILERDIKEQMNTAYKLQRQLAMCDEEEFCRMMRMPPMVFDYILRKIAAKITYQDTPRRNAIEPAVRLSLTLKFLATGESALSLAQNYRLGRCSVYRIIHGTCRAIRDVLGPEYMKTPDSQEEWKEIITQYNHRWNYPGCLGAIDGKHIRIAQPADCGSLYYNYKGFHSIVLMAVANGNYEFIYANAGAEGRTADGGCWRQCDFAQAVANETLNIPPDVILDENVSVPCHFVADDAFPMGRRILKPYPHRMLSHQERIFNYRLSRARRLIENCFGIITSRFQVLRTEMRFAIPNTINIVLAICVLHNVLRRHCGQSYMAPGSFDSEDINYHIVPGEWRNSEQLVPVGPTRAKNPLKIAKDMRSDLTQYFLSEKGAVPWQAASVETVVDRTLNSLE